ncbi:permease [bacterium]|nr:permease [bacterium]
MDWKRQWKSIAGMLAVFAGLYWLPLESLHLRGPLAESVALARWYAREHVLLCLVPAFFIAGAIGVFVSQNSVMKYLGPNVNKALAYSVASIAGTVLAVCSCTVLPLFAGIYKMGAGLGPATAFLYSGPAINVLAMILTARVLGLSLGVARVVGAVGFSLILGLAMHFIFRREEAGRAAAAAVLPEPEAVRPLWRSAVFFGSMVAVLVFANWGAGGENAGFWHAVYSLKWWLTGLAALALAASLVAWYGLGLRQAVVAGLPALVLSFWPGVPPTVAFSAGTLGLAVAAGRSRGEPAEWLSASWSFARQILPLLFAGVLVAGFLLGRPGQEGIIPSAWIAGSLGGNSLGANFVASVAGAFMYFATLTEVPILQGLLGSGMGQGPALALLLAGPALSLPSMLVLRSIMGTRKTVVFVSLVVVLATFSGWLYGAFFA